MNWAKIKNAFIILLLVCNLVFFFVYYEGEKERSKSNASESDLIQEISQNMEKDGIYLEGIEIPNISKLPVLKVSDRELDFDEEKTKFSKLGIRQDLKKDGDLYLFTYNEDSSLDLAYSGDSENIKPSTFQDALKCAEKFLASDMEGISYKYYKHEKMKDGSFKLYFEESFNTIRILDGYMILTVKGNKVLNLSKKLMDVKEDKDKVQKLIPYSLALYRLSGMIDTREKEIKIVEMNIVQELIKKKTEGKLVSGEAFVYYRFTSEDGENFLIDAMDNSQDK